MRQAKSTLLKPPRREQEIGDHDPRPVELPRSANWRLRAFQLVRTRDGSSSEFESGAECCEKELKRRARADCTAPTSGFAATHMDDLAAYVTQPLRDRVGGMPCLKREWRHFVHERFPFLIALWPAKSLQEIVIPAGIPAGDHVKSDEPQSSLLDESAPRPASQKRPLLTTTYCDRRRRR